MLPSKSGVSLHAAQRGRIVGDWHRFLWFSFPYGCLQHLAFTITCWGDMNYKLEEKLEFFYQEINWKSVIFLLIKRKVIKIRHKQCLGLLRSEAGKALRKRCITVEIDGSRA